MRPHTVLICNKSRIIFYQVCIYSDKPHNVKETVSWTGLGVLVSVDWNDMMESLLSANFLSRDSEPRSCDNNWIINGSMPDVRHIWAYLWRIVGRELIS